MLIWSCFSLFHDHCDLWGCTVYTYVHALPCSFPASTSSRFCLQLAVFLSASTEPWSRHHSLHAYTWRGRVEEVESEKAAEMAHQQDVQDHRERPTFGCPLLSFPFLKNFSASSFSSLGLGFNNEWWAPPTRHALSLRCGPGLKPPPHNVPQTVC